MGQTLRRRTSRLALFLVTMTVALATPSLALGDQTTSAPLAPSPEDAPPPAPTFPWAALAGDAATDERLQASSVPPATDWVAPLTLGAVLATAGVLATQRVLARRRDGVEAPLVFVEAEPEQADEPLPAGLPGILHLGQDAVDRGAYGEALGWFDCAVRLDPEASQVHLCRGLCLSELDRVDEALTAYATAIAIDPADGLARFHLAKAHGSLGHERDAIEALAPLVKAMPELAQAAYDDPCFSRLRDHPSFLGLVGRL